MNTRNVLRPSTEVDTLYNDALKQAHLLIAGTTGSGKSVLVNNIMYNALCYTTMEKQFILIDPKRVELIAYKELPHTIAYASESQEMIAALEIAMNITNKRYREMQKAALKKYIGSDIYVIIDELADLMCIDKKHVKPLLQRLCQIGRAARVHVIACTQCVLSSAGVLPSEIKCNFDARFGLRTRSAQDSRNVLDMNGLETLPKYGKAIYMTPDCITKCTIDMISETEIQKRIDYWLNLYRHESPIKRFIRGLLS